MILNFFLCRPKNGFLQDHYSSCFFDWHRLPADLEPMHLSVEKMHRVARNLNGYEKKGMHVEFESKKNLLIRQISAWSAPFFHGSGLRPAIGIAGKLLKPIKFGGKKIQVNAAPHVDGSGSGTS